MKTQRPIAHSPAHAPLQPIPGMLGGDEETGLASELSFEGLPAPLVKCPAGRRPRPLAETSSEEEGGGASRTEAPVPRSLVSPSFTCLEPPHLANLTLENASECLMQH